MHHTFLSFFLAISATLFAQIEIPDSTSDCKLLHQNGNFSYCIGRDLYGKWVASRIYKSDIESNKFLFPDEEFFPELRGEGSPIWAKLEKQALMWAVEFDSLYVFTGKEIIPGDSITGKKTLLYKAILKGCQGDAIGFIIDPLNDKKALSEYAVPIDQIEDLTGIDLFSRLNVELQAIIEQEFNPKFWPFSFE